MTDFIQNPLDLIQIGRGLTYTDRFAISGIGMKILAETMGIVRNQRIGRIEYIAI